MIAAGGVPIRGGERLLASGTEKRGRLFGAVDVVGHRKRTCGHGLAHGVTAAPIGWIGNGG